MSAGIVVLIGNLARDFDKKSENAPYKSAIAVSNAVSKTDKSRGALFENITVWPGSPAGEMIAKFERNGTPIKKGAGIIAIGVINGEEYVPQGSDRTAINRWVTVSNIFFNNVGGQTRKDGGNNDSANAGVATAAAVAGAIAAAGVEEQVGVPAGGPILDL